MEPVLDSLAFRNLEEHKVGSDAIFRAAFRRLEADLVFLLPRTAPAQRGFQKLAIPAGSAVSMHKHWMRIPMKRSCLDDRAASNEFEVNVTAHPHLRGAPAGSDRTLNPAAVTARAAPWT